jgi:NDP-sugar pyrophosphorylase family protein
MAIVDEISKSFLADIKIVILAAGGATRMMPLSDYVTKPMLPILGVPLLGRIIDNFQEAGFSNFIIVYGKAEDQIVPYAKALGENKKVNIQFVEQKKPMGMADAILLTQKLVIQGDVDDEMPLIVTAGDILFDSNAILDSLDIFMKTEAKIGLPLVESEDPEMAISYGNINMVDNRVLGIVEKPGPEKRIGNYYSMPFYLFHKNIYNWLEKVEYSKRGEKELQDAIQMMIDTDQMVAGINLLPQKIKRPQDGEYHITYPFDFLSMNFRLLPEIEQTHNFLNTYLGENVEIAENCKINNTYVFPNAVIKKNCSLTYCIIGEGVVLKENSEYDSKIILESGIHDLLGKKS